jgi:hypothetical protein
MATAYGTYAALAPVKARLGIPAEDTDSDAQLTTICSQVNGYIESVTGRPLCPLGTATYTFDGYDAIDNRLLFIDRGVLTVSLLETATYSGGSFSTVPATDYYLRPAAQELQPHWPYTEIIMTNVPSANNFSPLFYSGYATVRITGTWGFAQIPDEITEIGEVMAVRAWSARQSGQTDQIGLSEAGMPVISRTLSIRDRDTLSRYRVKRPAKI